MSVRTSSRFGYDLGVRSGLVYWTGGLNSVDLLSPSSRHHVKSLDRRCFSVLF